MLVRLAACLLSGIFVGLASAADPPPAEKLPTPKEVQVVPSPYPPAGYRQNRYDVWQYYGVDRTGHFRPLVIYSPYGAYYAIDGTPYPWISNHPRDIMRVKISE